MSDRLDDAAAAFQLALDISPTAGLNHAFLAIARLLQGRDEEALALAQAESHDVFRNLAFDDDPSRDGASRRNRTPRCRR